MFVARSTIQEIRFQKDNLFKETSELAGNRSLQFDSETIIDSKGSLVIITSKIWIH